MNRALSLLVAVSALACHVTDGDVSATAALTGIALSASEDALSARQTTLSGTIGLGYTSPLGIDLEIRDGGLSLYRSTLTADVLSVPVDATLDLPYHSLNHLVAEATYNGQSISQTLVVDVPEPIASVSLTAGEDTLVERTTTLTGTVTLGYTGGGTVDLRIVDDGVEVYRASADGAALTLPLDETIELVSAGLNTLTLEATYDGVTVATSVNVTLPGAAQTLDVAPAADTVGSFQANLTGTATVGYQSDEPALVDVWVNGAAVFSAAYDVSASASVPLDLTVPLGREGDNDVVTRVSYGGEELSSSSTVTVIPDEPEMTFGAWAGDLVPSVSYTWTNTVTVPPPAGWDVVAVSASMDGGLSWSDAASAGSDDWALTLQDPDIGLAQVLVAADLTSRGVTHTTVMADTFDVQPVFACNSGNSMQPSSDLVQNSKTEVRTMVGYFGDAGAHAVSFVISANVPDDGWYDVMGANTSEGTYAVTSSFGVDALRCNNNNNNRCQLDYTLELFVDGASVCNKSRYGTVTRY